MLTLLLVLHVVVGVALLGAGRRLGRRAFLVAAGPSAAVLLWALSRSSRVLDGGALTTRVSWVPELGLSLDLRVDGFSLVMVLLVSGIGLLVHLYATAYFAAGTEGLHRLAGLLAVFSGSMLALVTAADLLGLYVAWELTSVASYLLIGWRHSDPRARASATQALLTTGAGGIAMLGGFVLIGRAAGTFDLAELAAHPPSGSTVDIGVVLVLVGAFTKSAQLPFSAWLPGAMVAPTPVSALLHSATLVKAGVYLVARFSPMFADQGVWRPAVLAVGLSTMLSGGWRAMREHDLKRILAFSTVSQLGFLVVLFGAGSSEATTAGVALLIAHALFKAGLFLVIGVIDRQAGTRDVRALGQFGPGWLGPKVVAIVLGASMAGVPLLLGFIAKEAAYQAWVDSDVAGGGVVLTGLVLGSVLTFAYTARLLLGAFRPGVPTEGTSVDATVAIAPPPAPAIAFWLPAAVLAGFTAVLGVAPGLASGLVEAASHSLDPGGGPTHLALWHGVTPALALTCVTVAAGLLLVRIGPALARAQARIPRPIDGDAVYGGTVRSLNAVADRLTGVVQSGSLPVYIGVILSTAVLVPAVALLRAPFPDGVPLVSGPGDWAAAGLLVVGGVAAVVVRHRMAAVLCLGAVGYGMALVFVLQGAPDLALTQVCVDTIGALVFVLVLRHLPTWFGERPTLTGRTVRLAISAAVGLFVFAFILIAGDARVADPVSGEFVARAFSEGGGRNVVNVVIVDIRGFDTMGEITVLAVAAMGVYSLARLSRAGRGGERSFAPTRRFGVARKDGGGG